MFMETESIVTNPVSIKRINDNTGENFNKLTKITVSINGTINEV